MNLENYYNFDSILKNRENIKRIFFYRICGTGMGAAACLLKSAGYEVFGVDRMFYPPMSNYLEESGIEYHKFEDFDLNNLKDNCDLIVVGNVVAGKSEDARTLEELGVPFCSFPAAIGSLILSQKKVIGLAGTHGKTTTTYLGMQVFENLGLNPGYFVGAVLDDKPSAYIGISDYFFIESDEYDSAYFEKFSKFRSYALNHMVLTSLEFDHADIFESIDDIKNEFRTVLKDLDSTIASSDWEHILDLMESEGIPVQFYGNKSIKIYDRTNNGTKFSLQFRGEELIFETNLYGKHNIHNLSSILLFALAEGFEKEKLDRAIGNLKLARRRQEEKGSYNESLIIDDFAHHPTAVQETISAIAQKYPGKEIIAYLEPGSATARSDVFQDRFVESLKLAKKVYIINPNNPTSAIGRGDMDFDKLAADLREANGNSKIIQELEQLIDAIKEEANPNSIQLIMSNSKCLGLWSSDFVKDL